MRTRWIAAFILAATVSGAASAHGDRDDGDRGQLGDGTRTIRYAPVAVYQPAPPVMYQQRVVYQPQPTYYAPPPPPRHERPAYVRQDGNRAFGQAVGAIAGGVIGNSLGHGNGRVASTAIGALLGGVVGGELAESR